MPVMAISPRVYPYKARSIPRRWGVKAWVPGRPRRAVHVSMDDRQCSICFCDHIVILVAFNILLCG